MTARKKKKQSGVKEMSEYVIALDQGTTSSRAVAFDHEGRIAAKKQYPFKQYYPEPGWVEHDPHELLLSVIRSLRDTVDALQEQDDQVVIRAVGVANQRETTIVWDRETGEPVCKAIVWQCRRTAEFCDEVRKDETFTDYVKEKTGLLVDAYFSATKIRWILDHIEGVRERASAGGLLFGTVDSWLIWNLSGKQRIHISDHSNCARTMLFDIEKLEWDRKICDFLGIPVSMLPRPVSNSEVYCRIDAGVFGLKELDGVPICGSAGDQQAALFGQCCFETGSVKNTYGTGCFTLMNTGSEIARSSNGLIPTVGWTLNGSTVYALEGSVFNGGSTIKWLRDELGLISEAHECDILAEQVADTGGVYVVPAFTGLGAPYWDMYARASILGITRGTDRRHIARAVLEGIAYQVYDLVSAMQADTGGRIPLLRVDGGASVSDVMMQFQSDLLGCPVERPEITETTAAGAASLAGLASGFWSDLDELREMSRIEQRFQPRQEREETMQRLLKGWHRAVERSSHWIVE